MQLSLAGRAVLLLTVGFLVVSFLPWTDDHTLWHGIGFVAGALALLLGLLMGMRASRAVSSGPLPLQMPTLALSALLALATFVAFLQADDGREPGAWVGLVLALAIFLFAYLDAAALMRMFRQMRGGGLPGAPGGFTPPPTPRPSTDGSNDVSGIDGDWQVRVDTPMGEQQVLLTLSTEGGELSGRANTAFGVQDFSGGKIDGNDLAWGVSVTEPLPVQLDFTATVEGDTLSGMVNAGPLGQQPFTGTRVVA